jgi:hypothetical protein
MPRARVATLSSAVILIGALPALAQGPSASSAGQDFGTSDSAQIKELQSRLNQRDAIIRDLLRRVQKLERDEAARSGGTVKPAAQPAESAAPRPTPSPRTSAAPTVAPQNAGAAATTAQNGAPSAAQQQNQAAGGTGQAAPGTFEVSPEAAQRALERALVQTGAALLGPWQVELVPSLFYQYQEVSHPASLALLSNGTVITSENVNRATQLEGQALLRTGLPFNSQIEVGIPYDYKSFSTTSRLLGIGVANRGSDVTGLGDLNITVTKQLLEEGDVLPGLFLSGGWNSNLGQTKNHIPLGTGFNEFTAGMTAVKRQDPLVFTTGFTYQTALEHNGARPGDQYTPAFGVLLAASPETSLRAAQQVSFIRGAKLAGVAIPGSEQTQGILTLGLLTILGRGFVMDLSVNIGETPDAPNVGVRLAFPIRLN